MTAPGRLTAAELQAAMALLQRARDLSEDGRDAEAEPIYRLLVMQFSDRYGPDHILAQEISQLLTSSLMFQGKIDEAIAIQEPLLEQLTRQLGPEAERTILSQRKLAVLYARSPEPERAVPLFEALLQNPAGDTDWIVTNLTLLAQTLNSLGRTPEAIRYLTRALSLVAQTTDPLDMEVAVRAQLSDSLNLAGQPAEAAEVLRGAIALSAERTSERNAAVYWYWSLADFEFSAGQTASSLMSRRQAVARAVDRLALRDPGEGSGERTRYSDLFRGFVAKSWDMAQQDAL